MMSTIDASQTAFIAAMIATSLLVTSRAKTENGVTPDTIVFGQAASLESPAAALVNKAGAASMKSSIRSKA